MGRCNVFIAVSLSERMMEEERTRMMIGISFLMQRMVASWKGQMARMALRAARN